MPQYPAPLTFVNPSFEIAGGWASSTGGTPAYQVEGDDTIYVDGNPDTFEVARSGTHYLVLNTVSVPVGTTEAVYQDVSLDSAYNTDIDAGALKVTFRAYKSDWFDGAEGESWLEISFYNGSDALISTSTGTHNITTTRHWTPVYHTAAVPANTRKIRFTLAGIQNGVYSNFCPIFYDDVSAELFEASASKVVVSQEYAEVVGALESNAQVVQAYAEIVGTEQSQARVYQQYAEALGQFTSSARVYQQYAEAITSGSGTARVYQQYAELLCNVPGTPGGGGSSPIVVIIVG